MAKDYHVGSLFLPPWMPLSRRSRAYRLEGLHGLVTPVLSQSEVSSVPPKVFLSHSSVDLAVAEAFVDLVVGTIAIHDDDVRCTSVSGNRLKTGAPVLESVRSDLNGCEVVVALISSFSRSSAWVLCEIGAAIFGQKRLFPVMVGLDASALPGPLGGLNAISLESRTDLGNILEELAEAIGSRRRPLNKVNSAIDQFLERLANALQDRPKETDAMHPLKQVLAGRSGEVRQFVLLLEAHATLLHISRHLEAREIHIPPVRYQQLAALADVASRTSAVSILKDMFTLDSLRYMCGLHNLPEYGTKEKLAARLLTADLSSFEV